LIRLIANLLAMSVFWFFSCCSWTAILAIIEAREVTVLDSCYANSGMCGVWLFLGGCLIGTTMMAIMLIARHRHQLYTKQKRKNAE
jgi:hypothetical protein